VELRTRNPRKLALAGLTVALATATVGFALSRTPATVPTKPATAVKMDIKGKLARVLVSDGDAVAKGQLIAYLDSSGYEADLKKAETELQQLEAQTQNAIKTVDALPGIAGFLPRELPQAEYVTVPVTKAVTSSKKAAPTTEGSAPSSADPYKQARERQQKARSDQEKASQELATASAELVDAQKARDSLRPKITQAETDAVQAEKKAAGAKDLLQQGAISEKRSQELLEDKESTAKVRASIQVQITESDRQLADTQQRQKEAQKRLDSASAELRKSDELLASAANAPVTAPNKQAVVATTKETSTKLVMRRMKMSVRETEAPAIPVKVVVDEKAMQGSETRIAELKGRIEALKARIAECKVFAPVTGFVRLPDGVSIEIAQRP
jgi:multidrug resistance efflux pump